MVIFTVDKKELYRSGRNAEVKKELHADEVPTYTADFNRVMIKILMDAHKRNNTAGHHPAA